MPLGTYSYTVTDANGCTATTTGTITEPSAVDGQLRPTQRFCATAADSTVTVSATGGTAPYTGTGTSPHAAGTYSYTVTDANGCTSTTTGNDHSAERGGGQLRPTQRFCATAAVQR